LVGLGEVAQVIHLPVLQSLAHRFEIAALCDVSPTLLSVLGDQYRVPPTHRFTDYRDLAALPDLDAVFVLNSDEYHADCTVAALEGGKHVLVEKPICLTIPDAERIVRARDAAGRQVMVGYMRRFAPAFAAAFEEMASLGQINYVRVRDIIGRNRLIIDQANNVLRPEDFPPEAIADRQQRAAAMVREAIGEAPPELARSYRLLCGLNSHDLSAMRELIGFPREVISAAHWAGGGWLHVVFGYDGFCAVLETGVDEQSRFDAHIEAYGPTRSVRIQYDTPYIRHLPTTLVVHESHGEAYGERMLRPTFKDPYTIELETFHEVATGTAAPRTTPEDSIEDLRLFRQIIDRLRAPA
jgi:predicted dehydrogenase